MRSGRHALFAALPVPRIAGGHLPGVDDENGTFESGEEPGQLGLWQKRSETSLNI